MPNKVDAPELFKLWESLGWEMCGSLVRLYVFSDKYDVPALRRLCLNQLFAQYEDLDTEPLDLDTIVYAFKNAPSESPLCRFLIDYFCICAGADTWDRVCESYETAPPLALLSSALQRYTGYYMRPQHDLIACDYHEHKDEEERDRCAAIGVPSRFPDWARGLEMCEGKGVLIFDSLTASTTT